MSGATKALESTGSKALILCVSDGNDPDATHALRRMETSPDPTLDGCVTGCGYGIGRPFTVYFAPADEVTCSDCLVAVLRSRA